MIFHLVIFLVNILLLKILTLLMSQYYYTLFAAHFNIKGWSPTAPTSSMLYKGNIYSIFSWSIISKFT